MSAELLSEFQHLAVHLLPLFAVAAAVALGALLLAIVAAVFINILS